MAASVMTAVPVAAEDSAPPSAAVDATPPPVLLAPRPADGPSPTAEPSPTPGSPDDEAGVEPEPSPFDTTTTPFGTEPSPFASASDTLISVNVVMAGETVGSARPSVRLPRMRLPLRKGHYGSKVARLQERLAWLGYDVNTSNRMRDAFGRSTKAAVKDFQAKNWLPVTGKVNKRTWKALRKQAEPVGFLPLECTDVKASLCVDKTSRTLRYVVQGKVRLTTDARFGAPGMETDEGVFAVKEKSFNHTSTLYHTWMPRAMFFNGHEAVHYSPDFARYGYLHGSHGCIGVRDLDVATTLFDKVDVGTRVYVYWG